MLTEIHEDNFVYKGLGSDEGICGLKILPQDNETFIVILTELAENTGASITNCNEKITNSQNKILRLFKPGFDL